MDGQGYEAAVFDAKCQAAEEAVRTLLVARMEEAIKEAERLGQTHVEGVEYQAIVAGGVGALLRVVAVFRKPGVPTAKALIRVVHEVARANAEQIKEAERSGLN